METTSSILQGWGFRVGYLYDPRGIRAAVTVRPIYPSFTVIWKKRTLVAKSTVENIIFLQLETGWTLENILSGTAKFGNNGWNTFKRKSWVTHMQRKRFIELEIKWLYYMLHFQPRYISLPFIILIVFYRSICNFFENWVTLVLCCKIVHYRRKCATESKALRSVLHVFNYSPLERQ